MSKVEHKDTEQKRVNQAEGREIQQLLQQRLTADVSLPLDYSKVDGERPQAAVEEVKPAALVVAHGMGKQIPYETLNEIANALVRAEQRATKNTPTVRVRQIESNGLRLSRAEVDLATPKGKRPIHVYECYWAPITEGRVGMKDVFSFLVGAGFDGIVPALNGKFDRWMFGGMKPLSVKRGTSFYLLIAVLVLASLAVLNSATPLVAAYLQLAGRDAADAFRSVYYDFSLTYGAVAAFGFVTGFLIYLVNRMRDSRMKQGKSGKCHPWLAWLVVASSWVTFFAIISAGALVGYQLTRGDKVSEFSPWQHLPFFTSESPLRWIDSYGWVFWGLVFLLSWTIRNYLIQYCGDLAAYLTGFRVSKFAEIRAAVQKACVDTARAVYQLADDKGGLVYDHIVVSGHSLGSVIAYDTLNALINENLLASQRPDGKPCDPVKRTKAFVTFGSPLDKTAFLFRNQARPQDVTREALAALKQPMIVHYDFRPETWINIYSKFDIVSAALYYYDPEGADEGGGKRVRSYRDPEANIYLAAHSHFWENALLGDTLRKELIK